MISQGNENLIMVYKLVLKMFLKRLNTPISIMQFITIFISESLIVLKIIF